MNRSGPQKCSFFQYEISDEVQKPGNPECKIPLPQLSSHQVEQLRLCEVPRTRIDAHVRTSMPTVLLALQRQIIILWQFVCVCVCVCESSLLLCDLHSVIAVNMLP